MGLLHIGQHNSIGVLLFDTDSSINHAISEEVVYLEKDDGSVMYRAGNSTELRNVTRQGPGRGVDVL